jgi:hypothetical protein
MTDDEEELRRLIRRSNRTADWLTVFGILAMVFAIGILVTRAAAWVRAVCP